MMHIWRTQWLLCLLLLRASGTSAQDAAVEAAASIAQQPVEGAKQPLQQRDIATAEQEFEVDRSEEREVVSMQQMAENKPGEPLLQDWAEHMKGFDPELLLTFPLAARSTEFFYETVEKASEELIRGGFFSTAEGEDSAVDFVAEDPDGNVIYERSGEAEGIFHFVAEKAGDYTFHVSNNRWLESKSVTFILGKGNSTTLSEEHIQSLDTKIKVVSRALKDIQTESTYLWIREKAHMKTIESIHRRVLGFCVVEFMIIVGVSFLQAMYIKGLLSDRRVL
mmetsp:Transcript_60262/g.111757  ORF Transcript_60262/g.111757 Transcript_60262/m.111757 type:complete len:279 (-) Transcript_60262:125-961(-)